MYSKREKTRTENNAGDPRAGRIRRTRERPDQNEMERIRKYQRTENNQENKHKQMQAIERVLKEHRMRESGKRGGLLLIWTDLIIRKTQV